MDRWIRSCNSFFQWFARFAVKINYVVHAAIATIRHMPLHCAPLRCHSSVRSRMRYSVHRFSLFFCIWSLLHATPYQQQQKTCRSMGIPHDDRCFSMKYYYTRRNHTLRCGRSALYFPLTMTKEWGHSDDSLSLPLSSSLILLLWLSPRPLNNSCVLCVCALVECIYTSVFTPWAWTGTIHHTM